MYGPVAIAIDPGTNIAVVANQTEIRQHLEPRRDSAILDYGDEPEDIHSDFYFGTAPSPAPQQLTVIGKGLTCSNGTTNLNVRLDGISTADFVHRSVAIAS